MAAVAEAEPRQITIPYRPRKWAVPMHACLQRWFVIVLHRRAGKTTAWLNHHQRAAINDTWEERRLRFIEPSFTHADIRELQRVRVYAHILPTLTQARAVAWEPLKYISRDIPGVKPNERDMSITYPAPRGHLRVVRLWGADNIDGLRGIALSGLSLDEFSQHPPGVFGEVLSKALADHLGYCAFLGTIKGKNQLYQAYEKSKDDPDWFTLWQDINVSLETEEGATITALRRAMTDDQDLIAKGVMTQEEYDQEWFLSPHAAIKGAYYSKQLATAFREGRIRQVPYDPALPVHDVWDLGKGPKMSVGMFQRFGREMRMIDYLEGQESDGIPQLVTELQRKPYVWGRHFAPHDIKATELGTGKTREETSKTLGWPFEIVPDIGVDDGISAGRLLLPRLWIDETRCATFVEALGQYRREWNERLGQFGDRPVHDWCVTADTNVLTRHGTYQIQYLPDTGEVLTPCGWKPYQHPRITRRNAPLVAVTLSDGLIVRCTPEHLFLTMDNGWTSAGDLRPGSLIRSSLTPLRNTSRVGSIVSTAAKSISRRAESACTWLFGRALSGLCLAAATSTIGTTSPFITGWLTSNAYPRPSTCPEPGTERRRTLLSILATMLGPRQRLGTGPRRAGSGISAWQRGPRVGRNGSEQSASVSTAGMWSRCWSAALATLRNIVPRRVKPLHIASVSPLTTLEDVWCLTVPDGHMWSLENGAVVHNSSHPADMFRYAAVSEEQMRNERQRREPKPPHRRGRFEGRRGAVGSDGGLGWTR